jgi:hypothetical protein
MPRLNTPGSAVCGIAGGQISVDGSIPSELSGAVGGYWGWLGTTVIAGPASLSGGTWKIHQDNLSTHTVTDLDSHAANFFAAGNGIWALWLAGTGVVSNIPGLATQPNAGLGWVSRSGQTVLIDSRATSAGLSVYSAAGALLRALPAVSLVNQTVRLESDILSYQDANGWHLLNVVTGLTPAWYPRTDAVLIVVPVLLGTTLCVIEAGNAPLTCRVAFSAQGYTVDTHPTFFNPDGIAIVSGVVRLAYGANAAESPDSLLETDLTMATGATVQGTVVAGSIVRVAGPTLTAGPLQVGPQEGSNLSNTLYLPLPSPVVDPQAGNRMTQPWAACMRTVGQMITNVSTTVQNLPVPPAPGPSFGLVATPAPNPTVAAFTPTDTLTLTSADTTIGYAATPPTKTLDLHVVPQGPDMAVQTNQGGVLSGDAHFTFDPTRQQVAAVGDGQTSTIVTDLGTANVVAIGQDPDGPGIDIGMQVVGGVEVAQAGTITYLQKRESGQLGAFGASTGETPGSPMTYPQWVEWDLDPTLAGVQAILFGQDAAGAIPGKSISATANAAGIGAASTLGGQQRGGTDWYVWQDATGAMRYGPARPTEDNSVSDTSGFLFGTGSGTVTHTGALTANELIVGNGGADLKAVAATDGQIPIGKTADGSVTLATITAGANVTITNAGASITIGATGGGSWIPLSLGVEPLMFVSDGAGKAIVVAF